MQKRGMVSAVKNNIIPFAVPIGIILSAIALGLSSLAVKYPELSIGITYDLTLTAPLIYFFLIRNKAISKLTVVPLFVIGIIISSLILPTEQQGHLTIIKNYVLPIVELVVIGFIVFKVNKTIKIYKEQSFLNSDFLMVVNETTSRIVKYPIVAKILATEICMFYYGFFSWKKPKSENLVFTGYKENGIIAILGIIIFLVLTETFIIHILIMRWSDLAAWVLTISSIYVAIQILAHLKAIIQRYSHIEKDFLLLKYGLFGGLNVRLTDIEKIELTDNYLPASKKQVAQLSLLPGIEPYNVAIHFKDTQVIEKIYGIQQSCNTVLLYIDNPKQFINQVNSVVNS